MAAQFSIEPCLLRSCGLLLLQYSPSRTLFIHTCMYIWKELIRKGARVSDKNHCILVRAAQTRSISAVPPACRRPRFARVEMFVKTGRLILKIPCSALFKMPNGPPGDICCQGPAGRAAADSGSLAFRVRVPLPFPHEEVPAALVAGKQGNLPGSIEY